MALLGNIWKKFSDLLPKTPRHIGTIITINDTGFYTVTLIGGGTLQVTGQDGLSISDRVFITDKRIDGPSPSLSAVTIEV